jgi:aminoglycoside 6'-N-acetyltransferase
MTIVFRPLVPSDYPLLLQWLKTSHWQAWWGEAEEELEDIKQGLARGEHKSYIVLVEGFPLAYIQSWEPDGSPSDVWQSAITADFTGIDMSIGPSEYLGRGYGPAILNAFAVKLFSEGSEQLIIDPDVSNTRAIRAYYKAGFRPLPDQFQVDEKTLVMGRNRTENVRM